MNFNLVSLLVLLCTNLKNFSISQSYREIYCGNIFKLEGNCLIYCIFEVYNHHGDEHITSQVLFHFLTENGYTENSPRANEGYLEACLRFRQDSLDYRCGLFLPIYDCIGDILSQEDFERFIQTMNMKVAQSEGQKISPWNWK
uniref:Uncharacterized protein n=1 Tax=Phlebotomus papatasi TaxID=29031 RepID=A0A1B0CZC7_PHLPP